MSASTIDTLDDVRRELSRLSSEWYRHYFTDRSRADEIARERKELMDSAIERFAKPEVAGCRLCEEFSIVGGPRHRASSMCESGRHPHCTCDFCW